LRKIFILINNKIRNLEKKPICFYNRKILIQYEDLHKRQLKFSFLLLHSKIITRKIKIYLFKMYLLYNFRALCETFSFMRSMSSSSEKIKGQHIGFYLFEKYTYNAILTLRIHLTYSCHILQFEIH
jgi:hypothetical protein